MNCLFFLGLVFPTALNIYAVWWRLSWAVPLPLDYWGMLGSIRELFWNIIDLPPNSHSYCQHRSIPPFFHSSISLVVGGIGGVGAVSFSLPGALSWSRTDLSPFQPRFGWIPSIPEEGGRQVDEHTRELPRLAFSPARTCLLSPCNDLRWRLRIFTAAVSDLLTSDLRLPHPTPLSLPHTSPCRTARVLSSPSGTISAPPGVCKGIQGTQRRFYGTTAEIAGILQGLSGKKK